MARVACNPGGIRGMFGDVPDHSAIELALPFLDKVGEPMADTVKLDVDEYGDVYLRWSKGDMELLVDVTTDGQYLTHREEDGRCVLSEMSSGMEEALKAVKWFSGKMEVGHGC